ncbi:hypothetical protein NLG97_g8365 [Lecanicillium saksenae]|uniref:Uncharacterized protein n=1 Tax=Lecanicillium saksenae TaxID=468837 RepID=A0ACC1QJP4_9HYPO|nr:hypothetical protein NLG97_g8365 [Lecanicillium saksenae]
MSGAGSSTKVAASKGKGRMTLQGMLNWEDFREFSTLEISNTLVQGTSTFPSPAALACPSTALNEAGSSTASSNTISREDTATSISTHAPKCDSSTAIVSTCSSVPIHGTDLKAFDMQITERLEQRFEDLKSIYCPALYSYILGKRRILGSRRSKMIDTGVCDFSMKWKYLGESEATAELYFVVQCGVGVGRKVRRFFNQPYIVEHLGTDFRIKVIESYRRLMLEITVLASGLDEKQYTLCGRSLKLSSGEATRRATLGGIIMVKYDSVELCYGLTAGHPIQEIRNLLRYNSCHVGSGSDRMSEGTDSDADEGLSTSGSASSYILEEVENSHMREETEASIELFDFAIGTISHDSFQNDTAMGNCDWGLIPWDTSQSLPNRINHNIELRSMDESPMDLNINVVVLTSRGAQLGNLACKRSGLFMSPGSKMIETMDLKPDSGSGLLPGDSGSWVANPSNGNVYGHLVAIDAFGEGYVVPIKHTLEDIKRHLNATRVFIPSGEDLSRQPLVVKAEYESDQEKLADVKPLTSTVVYSQKTKEESFEKPGVAKIEKQESDLAKIHCNDVKDDTTRRSKIKNPSEYSISSPSMGSTPASSVNSMPSTSDINKDTRLHPPPSPAHDEAVGYCDCLYFISDFFMFENLKPLGSWQSLAKDYFAVVHRLGGVSAVLNLPTRSVEQPIDRLMFMLTQAVGANTTSPATNQIHNVGSCTDEEITTVRGDRFPSCLPCPVYLFLAICRITQMRAEVARGAAMSTIQSHLAAISNSINRHGSFSTSEKSTMIGETAKSMLEETFQVAVRLYGVLTLIDPGELPEHAGTRADNNLRVAYRHKLLSLLRELWIISEEPAGLRWPFIVAGVAVVDGTYDDREFVATALRVIWASTIPSWGALWSLERLEKFWVSGKTGSPPLEELPLLSLTQPHVTWPLVSRPSGAEQPSGSSTVTYDGEGVISLQRMEKSQVFDSHVVSSLVDVQTPGSTAIFSTTPSVPISRESNPTSAPDAMSKNSAPDLTAAACAAVPFKCTGLKMFDIQIPERLEQRFEDLQDIFTEPLYNHLLDRRWYNKILPNKDIESGAYSFSMKLRYLGENETAVKLFIVILCGPAAVKKARWFFRQAHVQEELGSEFNILVQEGLRELTMEILAMTLWTKDEWRTLCGKRLRLSRGAATRLSTVGGIIMVTYENGSSVFGMTAGHAVRDVRCDGEEELTEGEIDGRESAGPPESQLGVHSLDGLWEVNSDADANLKFDRFIGEVQVHSQALFQRDSGAWVVYPEKGYVYGHLVAIDILGEGYVIPIQATLEAIKGQLDATEVRLPSQAEIQRVLSSNGAKKRESPSGVSTGGGSYGNTYFPLPGLTTYSVPSTRHLPSFQCVGQSYFGITLDQYDTGDQVTEVTGRDIMSSHIGLVKGASLVDAGWAVVLPTVTARTTVAILTIRILSPLGAEDEDTWKSTFMDIPKQGSRKLYSLSRHVGPGTHHHMQSCAE